MAYRGGAATWRRYIRFKHLATDQYLTIVPLASNQKTLENRHQSIPLKFCIFKTNYKIKLKFINELS